MMILVSGATKTLREMNRPDQLGQLLTPDTGNAVPKRGAWACDNAAFTSFNPAKFCALLGRIAGKPGCLFVAAPDVVGNARETAGRFYEWQPIIKSMNLPVALVLQDGQEKLGVPWEWIDAVFVGGSTGFKIGPVARSMVREAKARGLHVHMGRVNTMRGMGNRFSQPTLRPRSSRAEMDGKEARDDVLLLQANGSRNVPVQGADLPDVPPV